MDEQKRTVLDFLQTQQFAIIATTNEAGEPNAALIGFGFTQESELIFGTGTSTRKYANLQHHQRVAFVVGSGSERITVQYEGVAEELHGEEAERYAEIYYTKNPAARKYAHISTERSFKVRPLWLRYSDYTVAPHSIFEIDFTKV